MGQRLIIQICEDSKIRTNCYYHWSGYTEYALPLVLQTMKFLNSDSEIDLKNLNIPESDEFKKSPKFKYFCAHLSTGAGISAGAAIDDYEFRFPYSKDINRNDGLIAINDTDIYDALKWGEQIVNININSIEKEIYADLSSLFIRYDFSEKNDIDFNKFLNRINQKQLKEFIDFMNPLFNAKKPFFKYFGTRVVAIY